ncbi:DNA-binding protein [Accumulibacter sp.]|uniref:DNA-binding protein n=1 Tax=Accumulibacter sp. TaxID=2053492 RepID=UPI0028789FFD|nr:DNA-binding protein [Accumulibacter sp.]MDS4055357.1 DNA-binding protein [Accumulibacter sp.]
MAITKDQIFAVADELDANGQNATLAAVRKVLGGGSFTTISEAMTEWRERKAAKETPLREPAPPSIADRLNEFGAELWSMALDLANRRLAAEREALDAARVQLEAEKQEAAELADQVTGELEALQGKVAALEAAELTAKSEAGGLRQQLALTGERAATAEARAGEIEKRADDLNAELARVNSQNAELVKVLAGMAKVKPEDKPEKA